MLAPITYTLALTTFRRARLLDVNGRVLVRTGQKVSAGDVVAEAAARDQHQLIDLYQALNLGSRADIKQILQRKPGDRLQGGDVIASTGGLFKKILRAPSACQILAVMASRLLLEMDSPPITMKAGISGVVAEVIADRGAIIEASGALIQGVWGNGNIDSGSLRILGSTTGNELTPQAMDVTLRGLIGFCPYCGHEDALQAAADLPLRGLILGSMPSRLIPLASRLPIPILLLEGFGKIPVNQPALKILSTSEQRDVSVYAAVWDHFKGVRPEALISLPAAGNEFSEAGIFKQGQTVRVHIGTHQGLTGVIDSLPAESVLLPGGIRSRCAALKLENNQVIHIPLENLDILRGME